MNNVVFNVNNLRVFDCKIYTHVFKITNRHKLDDRCWKNIHVDYEKNNQWKIYDSIIKKVHLFKNVKFDENYNYYDVDTTLSKDFNEKELLEIEKFWNFDDDINLDIQRRFRSHKINEVNKFVELNAFITFESFIESQEVNNAKYETKKENIIDINDLEKFHDFSLLNNSILETITFASSQLQFIREFFFENQLR